MNKRSPLENLAKRIIVAPFFTLYYEVRNKAVAPEKSQKINNRRATFIPDSRVLNELTLTSYKGFLIKSTTVIEMIQCANGGISEATNFIHIPF